MLGGMLARAHGRAQLALVAELIQVVHHVRADLPTRARPSRQEEILAHIDDLQSFMRGHMRRMTSLEFPGTVHAPPRESPDSFVRPCGRAPSFLLRGIWGKGGGPQGGLRGLAGDHAWWWGAWPWLSRGGRGGGG